MHSSLKDMMNWVGSSVIYLQYFLLWINKHKSIVDYMMNLFAEWVYNVIKLPRQYKWRNICLLFYSSSVSVLFVC